MARTKSEPAAANVLSSASSSSGTSSGTSSSTSTSTSSYTESTAGSRSDYWSTDAILARAARGTPVSAAPNSSIAFEPRREMMPFISLGPVVGMVTDTTARILIETTTTCSVKCFLTDKRGVQHGVINTCQRHRPTVFQFEELRADTYYKISFDIPVPGLVKAGFHTLPPNWSVSRHPARIAAVSYNNFVATRDSISHSMDLWKSLYGECSRNEIDYILHLGNIAFIDSNNYKHTKKGREYVGAEGNCAYREALKHLEGLHPDQLSQAEGKVCEMFRHVYRDTWTQPTTRHVLANAPNLMILNDHEIYHRLGDDDTVPAEGHTVASFLHYCAYRVYNEYCRALFEDIPHSRKSGSSASDAAKVGQAYHFHAFGDVGLIFLDTRAQRTLHKDWDQDGAAFLGNRQWADLDFALSDGGYLTDCRVLMVCTACPIAQLGEPNRCATSSSLKQLTGTWNTPLAVNEASQLLTRLFEWKARKPGRKDIVLVSGTSTDAGISEICDLRYHENGATSIERIKQVVTGPVAAAAAAAGNCCCNKEASLSAAGTCRIKNLGPDHQFKHLNIVNGDCNYALIDVDYQHGSGLTISTQHVIASGTTITARDQPTSKTSAGGCWAKQAGTVELPSIADDQSEVMRSSDKNPTSEHMIDTRTSVH